MNAWVIMNVLVVLVDQLWFHMSRMLVLPSATCWSNWAPACVSGEEKSERLTRTGVVDQNIDPTVLLVDCVVEVCD